MNVTGECIRDKIATSKREGMWMGGFVPLGYDAKDRSLVVSESEAVTVRKIFDLCLERGSVKEVKVEADRPGLTSKLRTTQQGRMRGGRPFSRGYIYKLLNNPIYAGRIAHKGEVHDGLHDAVINPETWDAVQAKLASHCNERQSGLRVTQPSLLAGLIHDDQGNRFSPSHAVKNGRRYRYYVSQAVLQGRDDEAGSVTRIPAQEIEDLVDGAIRALLADPAKVLAALSLSSSTGRVQRRLLLAAKRRHQQWPGMGQERNRCADGR